MKSYEIRSLFLDFFKRKSHLIVKSAPLVLKDDPTLMFINSGMAQFKDAFLGYTEPASVRIADTQKCLRVTGKHNDLEDVGYDTYHHTFFEMLGNWSFGDYFKEEAIAWSWELLTEVYKLPKDRLYATVFGGDSTENLERDHEAYQIWLKYLPAEQILFGSKKDNFWEMGETGPCGPCSEIHMDLRSLQEIQLKPGREEVNQDNPHVIEIWNNVFMQYERKADKSLVLLPKKHVDTGMGFERLCMVIQGKKSSYETDLFQPIIEHVALKTGVIYGAQEKTDIALRVIADHIRAVSFTIADGQLPSNTGAGYVIRRILRRAIRYGYSYLNLKEPFLYELLPILSSQFQGIFPEISRQEAFIQKILLAEETSFLRTLENGLKRLDEFMDKSSGSVIDGKTAFELYDTYGFPVDLTSLIAKEKGASVDVEAFKQELAVQKERSRKAQLTETTDWVQIRPDRETEFVGYDHLETIAEVIKYRLVKGKDKKNFYQIVLDKTPFYAESGGQVGDRGVIIVGDQTLSIIDTKKENNLIVHITEDNLLGNDWENSPAELIKTLPLIARVEKQKRYKTAANHSATHLMHAALRNILGTHVAQKGSFVSEDVLRFDFSHFSKVSEEEILTIEKIVNEKIRENIFLKEERNVPVQKAIDSGAMALFGEKYADYVRVITFEDSFSKELCGGTHVKATGEIGYFKIISEGSVSAGVRRIEAFTGQKAEQYVQEHLDLLKDIQNLLKNPKDLLKSLETALTEKVALQKELEKFSLAQAQQEKQRILENALKIQDVTVIIDQVFVNNLDYVKQIAFDLKSQFENLFAVIGAIVDQKPHVTIILSEKTMSEKNLDASKIIRELAKEIKGGGGGQPFYATAGGSDASGLGTLLEKAKNMIS